MGMTPSFGGGSGDITELQKERRELAERKSVQLPIPTIDPSAVEALTSQLAGGGIRRQRFALQSALLNRSENPIADAEGKRRVLETFGSNLGDIVAQARAGALSQKTRELQVEANMRALQAQMDERNQSQLLNVLSREITENSLDSGPGMGSPSGGGGKTHTSNFADARARNSIFDNPNSIRNQASPPPSTPRRSTSGGGSSGGGGGGAEDALNNLRGDGSGDGGFDATNYVSPKLVGHEGDRWFEIDPNTGLERV